MKRIIDFIKKETVLTVAWLLAIVSAFVIPPSKSYISYIDFRSLGILWSLMVVMQGLKENGVFETIGLHLLNKTKKVWQLVLVLVFLCFVSSMFITNDVALITFVPFAVLMLQACDKEGLLIPVVTLQTIAANLGSMMTPIGNPQNLYLYGISGLSIGEFILWMLPYTLVAAVLLFLSIVFMKGKTDPVVMLESHVQHKNDKKQSLRIGVYGVLFALALLVVAKVFPYYDLVLIVILVVFAVERKILFHVDYCLLLTFVGFFIFTGNMGKIPAISEMIGQMVSGREIGIGVLISQFISNVPAALLLSGFTTEYKRLLLGVNFGGLGTLIASMASLISYKILAHQYNEKKGKYLLHFTVMNILYLFVLMLMSYVIL